MKLIKSTVLCLVAIFSLIKAEAKKFELPLEVIAGSADLIVIGEINAVANHTYTFKISETFKGQKFKLITVNMFKEWTCDVRFDKAHKGQQLCLFLKKQGSSWEIINGSNGERPIVANSITLGKIEEYAHAKDKLSPYIVSLTEFKKGIIAFCTCYQYIGDPLTERQKAYFSKIGTVHQIGNLKSINDFSAWLSKKMTNYKVS